MAIPTPVPLRLPRPVVRRRAIAALLLACLAGVCGLAACAGKDSPAAASGGWAGQTNAPIQTVRGAPTGGWSFDLNVVQSASNRVEGYRLSTDGALAFSGPQTSMGADGMDVPRVLWEGGLTEAQVTEVIQLLQSAAAAGEKAGLTRWTAPEKGQARYRLEYRRPDSWGVTVHIGGPWPEAQALRDAVRRIMLQARGMVAPPA
jgi:hypothetical protein